MNFSIFLYLLEASLEENVNTFICKNIVLCITFEKAAKTKMKVEKINNVRKRKTVNLISRAMRRIGVAQQSFIGQV